MTLGTHRFLARWSVPTLVLPAMVYATWIWTGSEAATSVVVGLAIASLVAWSKECDGEATILVGDHELALQCVRDLKSPKMALDVAYTALEYAELMVDELNQGPLKVRTTEELALVWVNAANRARKRARTASENRGPYRSAP